MRKILNLFFSILLIVIIKSLAPTTVVGAPTNCPCTINDQPCNTPVSSPDQLTFRFDFSSVKDRFADTNFKFVFPGTLFYEPKATIEGNKASLTTDRPALRVEGAHQVELRHESGALACESITYTVIPETCTITVTPDKPTFQFEDNIAITIKNMPWSLATLKVLELTGPISKKEQIPPTMTDYTLNVGQLKAAGYYTITVYDRLIGGSIICQKSFSVEGKGGILPPPPPAPGVSCAEVSDVDKEKCRKCVTLGETYKSGGVWTALGCIDVSPQGFISWLLQKVIGIAGGIAFLLILYGGFQILTSTGDPEKLASG
ncbi:MAG: hypothetical protein AB1414_21440, partial [bacterium]